MRRMEYTLGKPHLSATIRYLSTQFVNQVDARVNP
jgi:hypothetical protein